MRAKQPPRDRRTRRGSERGISDVVGFTLMFSIIILSVGLVSMTGVSQLATFSESEEIRNAEYGMQSTAATLEDMSQHGDLNRTFSLSFVDGAIWMNGSTLNVTVGSEWGPDDTVQINSLEYLFDRSSEDVSVRYEGGSVARSDGAGLRYEPSLTCRDDGPAIVSVVNLTLEDSRDGIHVGFSYEPDLRLNEYATSGEAPVSSVDSALNFQANLVGTETTLVEDGTAVVDATETAGPDQWGFHFRQLADDSEWEHTAPGTIECGADRTLVRVTTIELELIDPQYN